MRIRAAAAAVAAASLVIATASAATAGSTWTTYHGDAGRTGVDNSESGLFPIRSAWSNHLDGAKIYGQPVVADGLVYVATEDDDVYALNANTGSIKWQHNIGSPLTNLPGCGDINPLGITSTPVIDLAANTIFVVGEVTSGGTHHQLVGFNLLTGQQTVSANADPATPAGQSEIQLQQRAALALGNGRVYVAYGGFDGDCGDYSGWVVGIGEQSPHAKVQFDTTPGAQGGAIWEGGGGPSIDSGGNVYATTGNPNGTSSVTNYADDVVKLGPGLNLLDHYHDSSAPPGADADLGTGDATLLPPGTGHSAPDVFAVGKTNHGYLLTQSTLGLVADIPNVCGGDPDGGEAYDAATDSIYVPCRGNGIQQVNLANHTAGWLMPQNTGGDSYGPPVLVNEQALWSVVYNAGKLVELDPKTGQLLQSISVPNGVPNFVSPTPALGHIYIGTDAGVAAFDGPPPPPPSPKNPGYDLVASDGGVFPFGVPFQGSLGSVHLNRPIVSAAALPSGAGYYLVASDGGVFQFGQARFEGSLGGTHLNKPIVAMAVDPAGGYWLVASDGGVFQFGKAPFFGSLGNIHLNKPIVGMAALPNGQGYWLVASDGGIFQFGRAPFRGSTGGVHLNRPIVAMAGAPDGGGYWLVATDGGVFPFGTARFEGSLGNIHLNAPIVTGLAAGGDNRYWLIASDGGVFPFGPAVYRGSLGNIHLNQPIVTAVAIP